MGQAKMKASYLIVFVWQ